MNRTPEQVAYERQVQLETMRRALSEAKDFITLLVDSRPKQVTSLLRHSGEELEKRLDAALVTF